MNFHSLISPDRIIAHPYRLCVMNILLLTGIFTVLNLVTDALSLFQPIPAGRMFIMAIGIGILNTYMQFRDAKRIPETHRTVNHTHEG